MKNRYVKCALVALLSGISPVIFSQNIGINTTGAHPSINAILDLNTGNTTDSINKYKLGFIPPHVELNDTLTKFGMVNAATANDTGMLVYNMGGPNAVGYYYWNGTTWVKIAGSGGGSYCKDSAWLLTGNSNTNPVTNWLGTNDAHALLFKVDGQKSGYIDYSSSLATASFGFKALNINTGSYNSAFGYQALLSNTTGSNNTALGYSANVASGALNNATAIGANATVSASNTMVFGNSAVTQHQFYGALMPFYSGNFQNGTPGQVLTSQGTGAPQWLTPAGGGGGSYCKDSAWLLTGNSGTVVGTNYLGTNDANALEFKVDGQISGYIDYSSGLANTSFGFESLNSNTGVQNTALGYYSLYGNTTGSYNAATGYYALENNTTGTYNTASGWYTLYHNTTGQTNTASGSEAMEATTTGSANTATGWAALTANTTGGNNTAMGEDALYFNVAGNNATALGFNAMFYANNTATAFADANVAVGYQALYGSATPANNTGNYNTALGYQTLHANTTGLGNIATGYQTLYNNTSGYYNTAIGYDAMLANTGGWDNTGIGYQALYVNSTGDYNTSIGIGSMDGNTSGTDNTGIGVYALNNNTTGAFNTALGYNANVVSGALTNATAIGNGATATASNSIELGNTAVVFCGINGAAYNASYALNVGTAATNGNGAYLTIGGVWTNASDRNKKENFSIPNVSDLLAKINMLPILEWNYKGEPSTIKHIGPMAQDFYRIFSVGNDSISISTIDPAGIALAGVQALNQKLEAENEALNAKIKQLTESQNARFSNDEKEIAELKNMLVNMNQTQASAK